MWTPTHIQVTVHRAINILSKGKSGSDAFATIQLGKEKYQTSVQHKTTMPVWQEECDLPLLDPKGQLIVSVYHRSLIGLDDFLGQATLPLEEFNAFDAPKSRWYPLKNKYSKKIDQKNRGEIEIRVGFIVLSKTGSLMDVHKKSKKSTGSAFKAMAHAVGEKLKLPRRSWSFKSDSKFDYLNDGRSPSPVQPLTITTIDKHASHSRDMLAHTDEADGTDSGNKVNTEDEFGEVSRRRTQSHCLEPRMRYSWAPENTEEDASLVKGSNFSKSIANLHYRDPSLDMNSTAPPRITVSRYDKEDDDGAKDMLRQFANCVNPRKSGANRLKKDKLKTQKQDPRRHTLHSSVVPKSVQDDLKQGRFEKVQDFLDNQRTAEKPELTIPTDVWEVHKDWSKEELIRNLWMEKQQIEKKDLYIKDLEEYIDKLLVRVIETAPRILQTPYVPPKTNKKLK